MNVLVSGAARGIGLAIAERLARKGARVGLLDVLEPELEEVAETLNGDGLSVRHYVANIVNAQQVEWVTGDVIDYLGPLDVLVNNAGTLSSIGFRAVSFRAPPTLTS